MMHGRGKMVVILAFDAARCRCPRDGAASEVFILFYFIFTDSHRLDFDSRRTEPIQPESNRIGRIEAYLSVAETDRLALKGFNHAFN